MTGSESAAIEPFTLDIPEAELADLGRRLEAVRWPDRESVDNWSQGAPLEAVRALVEHWRTRYDWRRCERMLNGFGQYRTEIDGVGIHFLHVRSPEANALPIILTHGWPGSVIEFSKVIGPLTDPAAHGGDPADAFHVVVPSLPGYGFSDTPRSTGWSVQRIAAAWAALMPRLGYSRYVAQGGDWGAAITTMLGRLWPKELAAIHVNMPLVMPADVSGSLSEGEARMLSDMEDYARVDNGYAIQQSTRPQTLGYGLADSPVGQAAWIYEKFWSWTDNQGSPTDALGMDEMLDNIMLYWLPNKGASSARLYWESFKGGFGAVELDVPTGCSVFPHDIYRAPRSWAERSIHNLIHWNEVDRGGHFAAFEQPALFVDELRTCFRSIR
ncbi:epoxide hydrolase family protein [Sphingomonas sp. ID0503]|uniref:epoxide hydrolase family protein n=1 Tax=Sphingomonas sp. ID0503 TaxID=3399691 RepID=UPI003AFB19C4